MPPPDAAEPDRWSAAADDPAPRCRLLGWILALVAVAALHFARDLLIPVVAAALLAFLLRPLVRTLERWRVPSLLGAALVVLLSLILPALMLRQLGPAAMHWMDRAPEAVDRLDQLGDRLGRPLDRFNQARRQVTGGEGMAIPVEVTDSSASRNLMSSAGQWLVALAVMVLLLYFMLVYGEASVQRAAGAVRGRFRRRRIQVTMHRLERDFGRYLATITLINIGLGVCQTLAMFACGMPNPLLWGAMCTLLNFVPYVGAAVGTVVVGLVALLTFDPVGVALVVPGIYLALTSLEGYLITPMILGLRFHLNPLVVLLAIVAWGWLWGIPGALMSVPLLVALKVALGRVAAARPLLLAIGDGPPTARSRYVLGRRGPRYAGVDGERKVTKPVDPLTHS